jgi:protein TonB
MRLGSFLTLSVGLHAAALAYPITFASRTIEAIRVTILPIAVESTLSDGNSSGNGAFAARARSNAVTLAQPAPAPCCTTSANHNEKAQKNSPAGHRAIAESPAVAAAEITSTSDSRVALTIAAEPADAESIASLDSQTGAAQVRENEASGPGSPGGTVGVGMGNGNTATGLGSGPGSGIGLTLTQARYSNAPRPEYPESARREGREGRVLLRVLVDERGRSRNVEIHSSSGSEALDRAAAQAIRRWRFDPARYGDQPVESWLRIPIEFRLTDAKSW